MSAQKEKSGCGGTRNSLGNDAVKLLAPKLNLVANHSIPQPDRKNKDFRPTEEQVQHCLRWLDKFARKSKAISYRHGGSYRLKPSC
jgi:hypothetical protein